MRRYTARRFLVLAGVLTIGGPAISGVKEGVDAWQAGDYPKAISEWRGPADKGDADAQFNLGQAYKLGRGVTQDMAAAQGWYLKAANQGHEQAQANLGLILFQNGDRQGAMPWIRKAADRGEPRAQYVLGTAMFNGDLVPRDWPKAYALMTRSAASGLPQAATSLQQMDQYLPPADRQAGIAIAREMERGLSITAASKVLQPPAPTGTAAATAKPTTTVKPAPVRTAAPPAAAPKPVPGNGNWKIQLGAYASNDKAETAWRKLASRQELSGVSPIYTSFNGLTRLQAGPVGGKVDANRICQALQAGGFGCFPVAP